MNMNDSSLAPTVSEAIETILPALDAYVRFATPEATGRLRAEWSARLEEALPQQGAGSDATLALLRDVVIPNGMRSGFTGFTGWMSTMPSAVTAAASLAATIAGPQRWWVQAFNTLEALALRWLGEMLGLSSAHQGVFTSGGAIANLVALTAARQAAGEKLSIDIRSAGLTDMPPLRLYLIEETHHIVHRAAATLGLGRQALAFVAMDSNLRMDVADLRRQVALDRANGVMPMAVVATAGATNTGAIDPLPEIAAFCREEGIWMHIDGAYGLLGVLDPDSAPLYGDLSSADSLVIDPHKWLNAPIGCGATFVRDRALMYRTFALGEAAYLDSVQSEGDATTPVGSQFADYGYQFHELGLELSAPSRGVAVWAILKEIGVEGVRERVQRNIRIAQALGTAVQSSPTLELVTPVSLSICCFRYVPPDLRDAADPATQERLNALNRETLYRIQSRGRCIPSGTTVHGKFVIRPCYLNPRATEAEALALITEANLCGAEVWAEMAGR